MPAAQVMPTAMDNDYHYLFGPVPSRRFGRSLGVDLTPYKTCSLDCVFCQLGRTVKKTVTREAYVPASAVMAEMGRWLKTDGVADVITLSGSGEPTLHSHFGEVLGFIHTHSTIPTVLLTNGTMLCIPEVREAAMHADIVKVSLSAWDQTSFRRVNRPHPKLSFDQLVEGQKTFRAQFEGRLWMEIFLVGGMNSMPSDVRRIATVAREIAPDRIQLNTAVRPPAEDFAAALSPDQLAQFTDLFEPPAEVIAEFRGSSEPLQVNQDSILAMLHRRPCTSKQIAIVFGMHINEVAKTLGKLLRNNQIRAEHRNGVLYYTATNKTADTAASNLRQKRRGCR
ncbi:MAG: radical SAM protein [Desulfobacterales bacterium]|jgi:wyosine [tRNA(Phe)-imidazoG37] synthetase (radical SAM superfamily)